ncbi:MAG: KH domain-containing protein, partial [Nitrosotalea sp.]
SRDPLLTVQDRDLGKIDSGELVTISPSKVPRLIGKRGSMIQTIEMATKAIITIGQNGWIVISCEDSEGLLKAVEAVKMIDALAHTPNLTERVKSMLGVPDGENNDTIND